MVSAQAIPYHNLIAKGMSMSERSLVVPGLELGHKGVGTLTWEESKTHII